MSHHFSPSQRLRKRQFGQQRQRRPSSPSSSPSPTLPITSSLSEATTIPSPTPTPSSADSSLPQNEPNVTLRRFPYTPPTGANNSLYIIPNIVAATPDLVEIKVGLLLPFSLPNNLTQQLAYSGTSAIRLAVSEINAQQLIPGAYITLVLKDSFNGLDPDNSGAAQAIFSTVSLLQTDGG
ncbi:hypothetical protein BG006_001008, partial [Podila minutissima]